MKQIENLKKKKLLTLCRLITRARPGSLALASLSLALASLLLALASLSLALSLSSDQQFSEHQVLCYIFSPRNAKPTQTPPQAGRNLLAALRAATRALSSSNLDRSSASSSLLASRDRNR